MNTYFKSLAFSLLLSISSILFAHNADLVIFSFDRPLQLYALLESVEKHMQGIEDVYVIYRASNQEYADVYQEVESRFEQAYYLKQGNNPRADFKPLTLQASFNSKSDYIIFAVDDIIVKDAIDLSADIDLLEQTNAYGFYYRLGKNLTDCYSLNRRQPLPALQEVADNVFAWRLGGASCDWGYPHSVDMTLVRKQDIKADYYTMSYYHPNTLEASWAGRAGKVRNRLGLCHEQSKIVNLPLNRVQNSHQNRNMEIPASELLDIFKQGKKIDISCVYQIDNKSAHWPMAPSYIER